MTLDSPTVFIVDDEPAVLKSLSRLLLSAHLACDTFTSTREFLDCHDPDAAGCLLLDVAMPGLNGLELQETIIAAGHELPIVFLTGHGDISMSVQAMKRGAVDFLTKPVSDDTVLAAIRAALEKDRLQRLQRTEIAAIEQCIATLTPREREVLDHVVAGQLNKQIAGDLGTVEKTIKVHRARMMAKMKVHSVAELVHLNEKVRLRGSSQKMGGSDL